MNKIQDQKVIGVALSYMNTILNILVNLIYARILISMIGDSEFGLYQLVASFFAYITIFESSISNGVLRFYCDVKAKGDETELENLLAHVKRIYRKLSIFIFIIGNVLIVVYYLVYRAKITDFQMKESIAMLAALMINLLLTVSNSMYLAAINGNERFIFAKSIQIFVQICQPFVAVLIMMRHPYAYAVVAAQFMVNILVIIMRRIYCEKRLHVTAVMHNYDIELGRSILRYSQVVLLAVIADQIFWKADQLILGRLYDTTRVAVYSIGSQIYVCYMHVGTAITAIFFPMISRLYHEENGIRKLSDFFIKSGRVMYYVLYLVLSGFVIFGREFITYWVGERYSEAYAVALIVMVPFSIELIQNLGLPILQAMNKYGFRAKIYFVSAALNVITTIILAKLMGINGAALSTGISMFVTSGVILNLYYQKLGFDIAAFWKSIGWMLVKCAPYTVAMYFINAVTVSRVSGVLGMIVRIVVYTAGYIVLCYAIVVNEEEKQFIGAKLKRRTVQGG